MQYPEANAGNYKVDAENLHKLFEHFNRKVPFGFQLDWQEVVQGLNWCVQNNEQVEVKTLFPNCYLRFEPSQHGDIVGTIFWNKIDTAEIIVARTVVGDFLRAVDGYEEDNDEQ
jgi:hypothetical protein